MIESKKTFKAEFLRMKLLITDDMPEPAEVLVEEFLEDNELEGTVKPGHRTIKVDHSGKVKHGLPKDVNRVVLILADGQVMKRVVKISMAAKEQFGGGTDRCRKCFQTGLARIQVQFDVDSVGAFIRRWEATQQ